MKSECLGCDLRWVILAAIIAVLLSSTTVLTFISADCITRLSVCRTLAIDFIEASDD